MQLGLWGEGAEEVSSASPSSSASESVVQGAAGTLQHGVFVLPDEGRAPASPVREQGTPDGLDLLSSSQIAGIAEVRPDAELKPPAGALVKDLAGGALMPGFVLLQYVNQGARLHGLDASGELELGGVLEPVDPAVFEQVGLGAGARERFEAARTGRDRSEEHTSELQSH